MQQRDTHLERFLPRFAQFVVELRLHAASLNLDPETVERFTRMERALNEAATPFPLTLGLTMPDKRSAFTAMGEATEALYREAVLNAHVLLAALEQSPGTAPHALLALKEALGRAPTIPDAPKNLAVQRHDNGVIGISWQHEPADPETEFEIAIAVGAGSSRGKPRDPRVPPFDPKNWHERWRTPHRFFLHEATARGGGPIRVDTVIWYCVRAIHAPDIPSAWSRRLEVISRPPADVTKMTRLRDNFGLFVRRSR